MHVRLAGSGGRIDHAYHGNYDSKKPDSDKIPLQEHSVVGRLYFIGKLLSQTPIIFLSNLFNQLYIRRGYPYLRN